MNTPKHNTHTTADTEILNCISIESNSTIYLQGHTEFTGSIATVDIIDNEDVHKDLMLDVQMCWSIDGCCNYSEYASVVNSIKSLNDFALLHFNDIVSIDFVLQITATWRGSWHSDLNITHDAYKIYEIKLNDVTVDEVDYSVESIFADKGKILYESSNHLFNPYANQQQHISLEEQMIDGINKHLSHTIIYFSHFTTDEDKIATLRQFEFIHTGDVKFLKVMCADNNFMPSNIITYSAFEVDFQTGIELHITRKAFESVFGEGKEPQQHDYMYIPIINAMLEVNSVQSNNGLMYNTTWYSCMCKTYEHRLDKRKVEDIDVADDVKQLLDIDKLVNTFSNFDSAAATSEQVEAAALHTMTTGVHMNMSMYENTRKFINSALKIVDERIIVNDIVVTSSQYDMSTAENELTVEYVAQVDMSKAFHYVQYLSLLDLNKKYAYQQIARVGQYVIALVDMYVYVVDAITGAIHLSLTDKLQYDKLYVIRLSHCNTQQHLKLTLFDFTTSKPFYSQLRQKQSQQCSIVEFEQLLAPVQLYGFAGYASHIRLTTAVDDVNNLMMSAQITKDVLIADDAMQITINDKPIIGSSLYNYTAADNAMSSQPQGVWHAKSFR